MSALHSWGFRRSHAVDISDYHGVILEMLERTYFLVHTYNDLLDWTKPRRPWLVARNPEARTSFPRGISAPVKPKDLIELEDDIERIFGVDFKNAASTAWRDADVSVAEPETREWLESARSRLAEHLAAESERLSDLMLENEVLVLPDRIEAYSDLEEN